MLLEEFFNEPPFSSSPPYEMSSSWIVVPAVVVVN
jgi:hypothetical protein